MSSETKHVDPEQRLWDAYDKDRSVFNRNALAEYYLGLVSGLASKLFGGGKPGGPEWDDLYNDGVIGLMEAIESFDRTIGTTFRGYAPARILGAMRDKMRKADLLNRYQRTSANAMDDAVEACKHALGHMPDRDDVQAYLGMTDEEFDEFEQAGRVPVFDRITQRVRNDNYESLARPGLEPAVEGDVPKIIQNDLLKTLLNILNEEERKIVQLYWIEERTMKETALAVNRSESGISRILTDVMDRLQARYREHLRALRESN